MKEHTPLRMSITGIDGSGKDTAYHRFLATTPENLTVVGINRQCSVVQNGEEKVINPETSQFLDNLHNWAQKHQSKRIITFANALWLLYSWRIQEKRLTTELQPNLVLALRDPYIDPLAYHGYYKRHGARANSIETNFRLLQHLHHAPISPNVVFLEVTPEAAIERINKRLENELQDTATKVKPLSIHENLPALSHIQTEYDNVLDHFQNHHGVNVTRVDTEKNSKDQVAEIVRSTLLQPFGLNS